MSMVTRTDRKNKVIAENETVWMGVDVHKKNAAIAILSSRGDELLFSGSIPMEQVHFEALMKRLPGCSVQAVYEAGCSGYRPLRWLREAGAEATMTAPSMVPSRDGDYVKTDRRDALKLARLHRGLLLEKVWDLTDEQYEHRELLRTRRQLVRNRTRICQQIKSKLLVHGHDTPEKSWSEDFLRWLEDSPTGRPGIDVGLGSLARLYRDATREIQILNAEIAALSDTEAYKLPFEILDSIPGVGVVTAMTFLTEIGSLDRFRTAEDFVSYLGLAPSEHSSGGRKRKGGLPRKGNAHIRNVLVQAAWKTIGKDARLRAVYDRIKHRNAEFGAQIAIVAVARRLALAMRAMLRDGTLYEYEALDASVDPPGSLGDERATLGEDSLVADVAGLVEGKLK